MLVPKGQSQPEDEQCNSLFITHGTEPVFFSVIYQHDFEMTKKFGHFGQNVWKNRPETLLQWILIQLWDKWPKCFSEKNKEQNRTTQLFTCKPELV